MHKAVKSVVSVLIIANAALFAIQLLVGDALWMRFALWPLGEYWVSGLPHPVGFKPWQLITSAFLHAGFTHLLLNMYGLWLFGGFVERRLGALRFLCLYSASVLTSGLVQLLFVSLVSTADIHPTVGASGGVYGVLLAFGMLFPHARMILIIPPIPMKAWALVAIYGTIELVAGVTGTIQGVAHFAHLGGMLGAFILMLAWRRRFPPAPPEVPRPEPGQ